MAYVITRWRASDEPNEEGNYVAITGRSAGLISYLLASKGFESKVSFAIDATRIEFVERSISGPVRRVIPLSRVSSSTSGYHKPWKDSLGWGFVSFPFALSWCLLVGWVWGILLAIPTSYGIARLYYFLNKTLTLGCVEVGGASSEIQFKRSLIEKQDIGEEDAKYISELLHRLVKAHQGTVQQG